jgi:hypothetical protein
LGFTTGGSGALNATRLVSPMQWQLQYNYLSSFEINEKGRSTMALVEEPVDLRAVDLKPR